MRWRLELGPRRPTARQRSFRFRERSERLDRWFKGGIAVLTLLIVAALLGGSATGRDALVKLADRSRRAALRRMGVPPTDEETDAWRRRKRARTIERTRESLARYYQKTSPEIRRLFDVAAMSPTNGLIGAGRTSEAFVLSNRVFARDEHGRSYRLRPNIRAVWLRQITLLEGPFGLFLVPDTPEVRAAAVAAGATIDEPSAQSTNSWGLRGPEPDPDAPARGLILGDSFMQGMFNGDAETPPFYLQRELTSRWQRPVSILNTGHIGYAPEQYYHSLIEYGDRFRPHFVIVSVCPNDFGKGEETLLGKGDDWDEAALWLGKIALWCRGRQVPCLLVPVPCDIQFLGRRKDGRYPAPVCDLFEGSAFAYFNPLDHFIDEHLRLRRLGGRAEGVRAPNDPLYNAQIDDNHFSPRGAAFWAEVVADRLTLLMKPPGERAQAVAAPAGARRAVRQ